MERVTILGGGNTAFSVAANLSLQGHEVTLWEIPSFQHTLAPIRETQRIRLIGVAEEGPAHVAPVDY